MVLGLGSNRIWDGETNRKKINPGSNESDLTQKTSTSKTKESTICLGNWIAGFRGVPGKYLTQQKKSNILKARAVF